MVNGYTALFFHHLYKENICLFVCFFEGRNFSNFLYRVDSIEKASKNLEFEKYQIAEFCMRNYVDSGHALESQTSFAYLIQSNLVVVVIMFYMDTYTNNKMFL